MHALILAICSSVAVSLLLKLASRRDVDLGSAIAANYPTAAVLCLIWLPPSAAGWQALQTPLPVLLALGLLLPTIFLSMGAAVRHAGIVRSDAAQRLSVFLPLLAAFLWFGQPLTSPVALGMALALGALILLLSDRARAGTSQPGLRAWPHLLAVWLGYGTIDILFKQVARHGDHFATVLLICFVLAALVMAAILWRRGVPPRRRDLAWGVALGLLNFANIVFYLRAHRHFPDTPALVFTAMNIGVIALGAVTGAALFRERPGAAGWSGVALAVLAIAALWPR